MTCLEELLNQQAKTKFWLKFNELPEKYPQVDMEDLRALAEEFCNEYFRFMDMKYKPESGQRRMPSQFTAAAQGMMAFFYDRLTQDDYLSVRTCNRKVDAYYQASSEECMGLGPELGRNVFGSIFIRLKDSAVEVYGYHMGSNAVMLTSTEKKHSFNSTFVERIYGRDSKDHMHMGITVFM